MNKLSRGLFFVFLCLLLVACLQKNIDPEYAQAQLLSSTFSIFTGKPGAPGEAIGLVRDNSQCFIELKRFQDDTPVLAQDRQQIPCDRFDQLWQKILAQDVLKFTPQESSQTVFDFGERQLNIQWSQAGENPKVYSLSWSNQLENENQIEPVVDMIAEIYQSEYRGNLQLFYFN